MAGDYFSPNPSIHVYMGRIYGNENPSQDFFRCLCPLQCIPVQLRFLVHGVCEVFSLWRALTSSDVDALTTELMGVSGSELESALKNQGPEFDALINKAAETNGISSEHMNAILDEVL